jgi:hypothetical protein
LESLNFETLPSPGEAMHVLFDTKDEARAHAGQLHRSGITPAQYLAKLRATAAVQGVARRPLSLLVSCVTAPCPLRWEGMARRNKRRRMAYAQVSPGQ